MYPKLRFRISYQKDIQAFYCFLKDAQYDEGRAFRSSILSKYPSLEQFVSFEELSANKTKVKEYVRNFYSHNRLSIKSNLEIYKGNWSAIRNQFYELTDGIFTSRYWPEGRYIAYPTMWGMYPRYLEDKTFQIPFAYPNKKYVNVVIAHEMLHFIFYEYFFTKWPKYRKDEYNFFTWNISEIFNTVVQNSPRWLSIFQSESMGYPDHQMIVQEVQKKYYRKEDWDVDELIRDIMSAAPK